MLLWLTDPHLNFLRLRNGGEIFAEYLARENPGAEGLLVTGDISSGDVLRQSLEQLARGFGRPVYFVLGNHDYYEASWADIDRTVGSLKVPSLHWLNQRVHHVGPWALVGVGGWYDARYGNSRTQVELSDFYEIRELRPGIRSRNFLLELVSSRADAEAARLSELLTEACQGPEKTILVATHVSPYEESSWHEGKPSDRDWVPWFSSRATGLVLDKFSAKHPEKFFQVFCGHSHSSGVYHRTGNLAVYTGRAQYGAPDLAGIIDPEDSWVYDSVGGVHHFRCM